MKRDDLHFALDALSFLGMIGIYVLLYKTYQTYKQYEPQITQAQQTITNLTSAGPGTGILQTVAGLLGPLHSTSQPNQS